MIFSKKIILHCVSSATTATIVTHAAQPRLDQIKRLLKICLNVINVLDANAEA
jgi:acetolactate synthase small subunit